ncbi:MAG: Flp pilus assembly complex ATPase component [Planctomycetes bacterium]|nr:Flp pilus assembly complex ATPase component [Planctomycetota bacterium]
MPVFDIYDDQRARRIVIDKTRITIGRTEDNDIIVDDRQASRSHCEVRLSDEGYILRDLKSRNGTMLDQDMIGGPQVLNEGDEIGIGSASIRFWTGQEMVNADAPKLPTLVKTVKEKKPDLKGKAPARGSGVSPGSGVAKQKVDSKPPSNSGKQLESIPIEMPEIKLVEAEVSVSAPPMRKSGPLTINHLIPLNHEGRPAHPVGKDAGEVSEAMLRLKQLLLKAFQFTSTDIHVEPKEDQLIVRYRIDGCLHRLGTLDPKLARSVYSIVRLLCNLDINQRNTMQDGSFSVQLPDRRVDLRISFAPSTQGDKLVVRILDKNLAPEGLSSLGMDPYILDQVRTKASKESSMIVVCGPTGSGKTTTIYAIIQEMNALNKNIVTVEDPVEYKLPEITQIQVNQKFDVTFASALASLLRQDPDVILVGEIRDPDTAQMGVRSAMTGHLVLTTVHARDSIGCIFRLLDLGVEPFLLGSALTSVLSQRLLRNLCPHCKMKYRPAIKKLSRMGLEDLAGNFLYSSVGCDECLDIGYKGRLAVFELMAVNDQIRDAIANRPTIQQLREAAGDWIFQTIRDDGLRKLKSGLTTLDEFYQISEKD